MVKEKEIIYLEYTFDIEPVQPWSDILIAQLGEVGFESFVEKEDGVLAYIKKDDLEGVDLKSVDILNSDSCSIEFNVQEIRQKNWNDEWEKNFDPISVDEKCFIRAPFHKKSNFEFDIVIEPKMSFGTGHHETTFMMIKHILNIDFNGKKVLDMGCGTAVLAILAELKGANKVDAIDIDHWCYLNSQENIQKNNCKNISVFEGDVALIKDKSYDVIFANINRNILLSDIEKYAKSLSDNGILLLSGFYKEDIHLIEDECSRNKLKLSETLDKNNWVSLKFIN